MSWVQLEQFRPEKLLPLTQQLFCTIPFPALSSLLAAHIAVVAALYLALSSLNL